MKQNKYDEATEETVKDMRKEYMREYFVKARQGKSMTGEEKASLGLFAVSMLGAILGMAFVPMAVLVGLSVVALGSLAAGIRADARVTEKAEALFNADLATGNLIARYEQNLAQKQSRQFSAVQKLKTIFGMAGQGAQSDKAPQQAARPATPKKDGMAPGA
jgi:hypothetical protein